MRFKGISLIGDGRKGVIIEYEEVKSLTQFGTNDDVRRICKTPISKKVREEIKRFKYFMLVAMGYWEDNWTKYLSDNKLKINDGKVSAEEFAERAEAEKLFANTTVTGIKIRPKGITISGTVIINDKTITPKYDPINPEDEYGIYDELTDQVNVLADAAFEYMNVERFNIHDSKEILEAMTKTEADKVKLNGLSEAEAYDEIISFLEEQGHVVILKEEMDGSSPEVTEQHSDNDIMSVTEESVDDVQETKDDNASGEPVDPIAQLEEKISEKAKEETGADKVNVKVSEKKKTTSKPKKEKVTSEDDW